MVKALIITGFGINCEEEMAAAYELAGAESTITHLNDIFLGKVNIHDFDIIAFPGGFSFGDDLGSGKVLANKMKFKKTSTGKVLLEEIEEFITAGKFIMGVCNGFQFLVKMGLLPDVEGNKSQEVTLTRNNSAKFEDRWCRLKVNPNCNTPFLKDIDVINLPVRHGEGKLIIGSEELKDKIVKQQLDCMHYCDEDDNITDLYPLNPNGSDLNCGALTDPTGQVFGLMPHPEAYLSLYNNPNWPSIKRNNPKISEAGEGLKIFQNIVSVWIDLFFANRRALLVCENLIFFFEM